MRLQVALDFVKLEDALKVASAVSPYVDILEAGTPLIKAEGMKAVRELSQLGLPVMADMKTMDTGYLEVELAAVNDAKIVSVMGLADDATIASAMEAARDYGVEIMVDMMNAISEENIKRVAGFRPNYLLVHVGIDQQEAGKSTLEQFEKMVMLAGKDVNFAVAGGLDEDEIKKLPKTERLEIVVVGGAIIRRENPAERAKIISDVVKSI